MTTVTPPVVPPAPATPTPAPPTATVPNPTVALLQLALGTRVEASVIAVDAAKGQVLLQTPLGDLAVTTTPQTAALLQKDAKVVLQMLATAPQVQLAILAPGTEGRMLSFGGRAHAAGESAPANAPAPAAPATIALTVGVTTTATLLRPTAFSAHGGGPPTMPMSGNTPPGQVPGAAGTAAATGAVAAAKPTPTPLASPTTQLQAGALPTTRTTPGGLPTAGMTTEGRLPPLPSGTQFTARIVALQPPAAQTATPPTVVAAPGTVLGQTVTGVVHQSTATHAVIHTPAGPLALAQPTSQPLPPGTQVTLALIGAPTIPDETSAPKYPPPLLGDRWPALEEAMRTLKDAAPNLHQHVATSAVPRADSGLAAGIVQFLTALKAGELGGWIGDASVRQLQRSRPDLADRLEEDFRGISRAANETDGAAWRVAAIPISVQQEIHQLRLLTRQPREKQDEKDGENARFVVDMNLSNVGRLQLDGLVHRKDKRLDLIVRTDRALPPTMRDDIRRLFGEALEVTGIKGSVGFQAQPGSFIEFLDALPDHEAGVTV